MDTWDKYILNVILNIVRNKKHHLFIEHYHKAGNAKDLLISWRIFVWWHENLPLLHCVLHDQDLVH